MARQRFCEEALCRRQVTVLAEPELNGVADSVDGAIEIHPSTADLDVSFVDLPPSADTLTPIEAFQQQGREVNDPAVDRRMIDADTALAPSNREGSSRRPDTRDRKAA